MNEDILKIDYEALLRNPDLIDRVQRDARRYRAREVRRLLRAAWDGVSPSRAPAKPALQTAACG